MRRNAVFTSAGESASNRHKKASGFSTYRPSAESSFSLKCFTVQLTAFFAHAGLRAKLAEVEVSGERLLVGAYPRARGAEAPNRCRSAGPKLLRPTSSRQYAQRGPAISLSLTETVVPPPALTGMASSQPNKTGAASTTTSKLSMEQPSS